MRRPTAATCCEWSNESNDFPDERSNVVAMEHAVREEQNGLVVSLSGDVDLDSSPRAREVLLDCVGRKTRVVVDLSEVAYMDSSGVASLVEALQTAKRNGSFFALAAVQGTALRVLELARLDRVFKIFASVEEGLVADA
jgi:anti-sigma B factor antagonist